MLVVALNRPMRVVVREAAGPELPYRARHVLAARARRRGRCDRRADHELDRVRRGRLVIIPHHDRLMGRVEACAEDGEADQTATQFHTGRLIEARRKANVTACGPVVLDRLRQVVQALG